MISPRFSPRQFGVCLGLAFTITLATISSAAEPHGTLNGTITDSLTGSPVACTVTITDATGRTIIEKPSFSTGFRSNGRFTKNLPPGHTRIRITRGFETRAAEHSIEITANHVAEFNVALERIVDLRKRNWFAGDSHAHMIHGERTVPVDFDEVALAARAEDLQYLSLSHAWTLTNPTPEQLDQELNTRSTPDCLLTWNLEAPKNYYRGDATRCLGHCWTLAMRGRTPEGHNTIPLLLQASAHDYESHKPTFANFESHDLIRAQDGAVFYTHPARWWTGPWGGQGGYPKQDQARVSNMAVELPLDTIIGPTFDGLDLITTSGEHHANAMAFNLWSLLLNHGYRLAGTASSDACFDRPGGATPGSVRTYTYLENGFSLPAVARAMTQGRNFVTSGPLLIVSLDNAPPGTTLPANGRPSNLNIEAWPSGSDPVGLTRLELLRNGTPILTNLFASPLPTYTTNFSIAETHTAWYCVRLFGGDPVRQRAISGAFFFESANHQPPLPALARAQISLRDAVTGAPLSGSITEVYGINDPPRHGQRHPVHLGKAELQVQGTARLRAEVDGYRAVTLSPFLDHPPLVEFITGLAAEDLLNWKTFERTRDLLNAVTLDYRLEPDAG
jgi:hypothetical protein